MVVGSNPIVLAFTGDGQDSSYSKGFRVLFHPNRAAIPSHTWDTTRRPLAILLDSKARPKLGFPHQYNATRCA